MTKEADFDLQVAHKYFAVECFNRAWDYIDKPTRTRDENDKMLELSLASLWHWRQREDCTQTNLSIGYWQVSRVYALMGQTEQARHYGEVCLEFSLTEGVLPFYRGYAYEALARAEATAGNQEAMQSYLDQARQVAEGSPVERAKKQLLDDLATIH
mgnify:CR=1 FL=1